MKNALLFIVFAGFILLTSCRPKGNEEIKDKERITTDTVPKDHTFVADTSKKVPQRDVGKGK